MHKRKPIVRDKFVVVRPYLHIYICDLALAIIKYSSFKSVISKMILTMMMSRKPGSKQHID